MRGSRDIFNTRNSILALHSIITNWQLTDNDVIESRDKDLEGKKKISAIEYGHDNQADS